MNSKQLKSSHLSNCCNPLQKEASPTSLIYIGPSCCLGAEMYYFLARQHERSSDRRKEFIMKGLKRQFFENNLILERAILMIQLILKQSYVGPSGPNVSNEPSTGSGYIKTYVRFHDRQRISTYLDDSSAVARRIRMHRRSTSERSVRRIAPS